MRFVRCSVCFAVTVDSAVKWILNWFVADRCVQCGLVGTSFKRCGRCFVVKYCDQKCQISHWKNGHRNSCVGQCLIFLRYLLHLTVVSTPKCFFLLQWSWVFCSHTLACNVQPLCRLPLSQKCNSLLALIQNQFVNVIVISKFLNHCSTCWTIE